MKKRILSLLLAALMLASLLPATAAAAENAAENVETGVQYPTLQAALDDAGAFESVRLLQDITDCTDDIIIPEFVYIDLNHHVFRTTGTITNNGAMILYMENADIVEELFYYVPGAYSAGEELQLPSASAPDWIIPSGTFLTTGAGTDPEYHEFKVAVFDDSLIVNSDIPAGMQLDVTYELTLGGDILSASREGIMPTCVRSTDLVLVDSIAIGSNNSGDGAAVLAVESIYDDLFGDTIGSFTANGCTITLNRTGRLILSADIAFDASVLVSGVDGCTVCKQEDAAAGTVTYFVGTLLTSSDDTYPIKVNEAKNGAVITNCQNAPSGSIVTITTAPDKGFTTETITVADKDGDLILVEYVSENKFSFVMPEGPVTVSATFMDDNTMLNYCVDVNARDYYYDAVLWAYQNEITSGQDALFFGPAALVSRAEVVTFLWRAAGSPVVNYAMNMTDVNPDEYYTEAVRWALSEGITVGTSATTFGPDETCKRGQIVTFLYRYAKAAPSGAAKSPFTDVLTSDYFWDAVDWAVNNKVTEGMTPTTFCPYNGCSRAEVVTFLYRWMVK